MSRFILHDGEGFPHGATARADGVNFSVFSRNATAATLLLYAGERDRVPLARIDLDAAHNRTFFFWHVFVEGAEAGLWYTWRLDGPDDTARTGHRFDPAVELLDPRARAVSMALWDRRRACGRRRGETAIRAQVLPPDAYDWEGDAPLQHRAEDSVIYELHVGGFTRGAGAGVHHPGTFDALVEKIPYLSGLGVTDVELMPVMAFDEQDVPAEAARRGLSNFWGYSPVCFFAPHPGYSPHRDARTAFRDMVKAMHRAGLGVILDVVLNHTAEGGEDGPTFCFKGVGNEFCYHLDPTDRRRYRDYSGCGNTLNCNHPAVSRLLLQCLEYWVREMHVDGFRFDLASAMGRGEDGEPMVHAPLLWNIEFSETLARTRLIGEAWDAGGLYQVGDFPGYRWAEWNGQYRDTVRRFVRGDTGLRAQLATRIAGSADLYQAQGKLPINSINFVTCHDGFTLADLVAYEHKHNEANGEDNRDGSDTNHACNHGHEGPVDDPAIIALRERQARNFLAILLLSQGTPMLLAGDEVLRSQRGNNNAYCQDNELGWFDWSLLERNAGMLRFTRELIELRRSHPSLRRQRFLTGEPGSGRDGQPDIFWLDEHGSAPDWQDPEARTLAFVLAGRTDEEPDLMVMINADDQARTFRVPQRAGRQWSRRVDTAITPVAGDRNQPRPTPAPMEGVRLLAHSVVVLEG